MKDVRIGTGGTSFGCGLTSDQIRDCYAANRSPRTGRWLRTSPPSALEKCSRKVNWDKLMIKGAAGNLLKVSKDMLLLEHERDSLTKAIRKFEQLMLNQLSEDYEAFKATELYSRNTTNVHEATKNILGLIAAYKADNKNQIGYCYIYHKVKRQVVKELTALGYKVTELTIGNTFSISWLPSK